MPSSSSTERKFRPQGDLAPRRRRDLEPSSFFGFTYTSDKTAENADFITYYWLHCQRQQIERLLLHRRRPRYRGERIVRLIAVTMVLRAIVARWPSSV